MPNITLSLPEDLKKAMNRHKDMNWSEVARQAIADKVHALEVMDQLLKNSKLTEKDIEKEAKLIKKRLLKHYRS